MTRKLVTVRQIAELLPIEGADKIELARVDGWQVVVKKGEFKVGDAALYFEVDSFLPIKPVFEFLRKSCFRTLGGLGGREGFRIKTIKLKGQLSQGLLLPLDAFGVMTINEDDTLDELLDVIKYEQPVSVSLAGTAKGNFPYFIPKTDQERIQNIPQALTSGYQMELSEKLDGTSFTCYFKNGEFGVCSRNLELKDTEGNLYWRVFRENNLEDELKFLNRNIAIQGEIIGEGIQKNRYKLKGQRLYVFDIFDLDRNQYLDPNVVRGMCSELGLDTVPRLEIDPAFSSTMEAVLAKADDTSVLADTLREGVVYKSYGVQPRRSFKVISNKWLLKNEE
jgi:RNA ligase (TIGR02306 family)